MYKRKPLFFYSCIFREIFNLDRTLHYTRGSDSLFILSEQRKNPYAKRYNEHPLYTIYVVATEQ